MGFVTGVKRNASLSKCESEPFYTKLNAKLEAHKAAHPDAKVIKLAIGDVSEPIPEVITSAMEQYARELSTSEGFQGYGPTQGLESLRNEIVNKLYPGLGISPSEVFITEGAKGCFGRLQTLFGTEVTMAAMEPSYPVIPQICALVGRGDLHDDIDSRVVFVKGLPENRFFPDFESVPRTDLIYFVSPNNPTGEAASRKQLEELVAFARKNGSIILYDSVYSIFIEENSPKSIYEIPGAREVAIEVGSFSKLAGFTGIRLGWTVIPDSIFFSDGRQLLKDFQQVTLLTFAAGASKIVQAGGLACLTDDGLRVIRERIEFYKENARILEEAMTSLGLKVYGGRNGPYLWVEFPGRSSDDVFNEWLEKANVLTSPGYMFGSSGEGFLRISAFGHREDILEAARRLKLLKSS